MAISIEPVRGDFAGIVQGVDCRQPLPPATIAAIEAGMDRFAVLVFPGQDFTNEEQLAFTLQFGPIEQRGRGSGKGNIHFRTAEQKVYRSGDSASHLVLPVLNK